MSQIFPAILSPSKAAERLNLSTSTLAKLRLSGRGPAYSKLGRRVVYAEADLIDWIESRKRLSTSER